MDSRDKTIEPEKLQKYSFFGGLLPEQIKQILPHTHNEFFNAGDIIIEEGSPNDCIYFIVEGRVAVIKSNITLFEFSEGSAFGEMEVLDIMPAAATIKTLVPTKVISISNKGLREIYKADVHSFSLLIMNLARELSRRLRHMDEMVAKNGFAR